jgi:type I restriction enzyme S subunit
MKKYQSYKPSGIEWIGDIPYHWEMIKLKYLGKSLIGLSYKPEDIVDDETQGLLVLRSSNIQKGKLSLEDNVYVKSKVKDDIIVKKGDILICSRNGSRSLIGKNITITKELEGNTFGVFMTIFRTPYWEYLSKVFNSMIFTNQSGLFLTSTINQLTQDTLNNFVVPFIHNETERVEIVKFLDEKTEIIDKLISTKERKIELLKLQRTSLINHVITKGLDSKVKMKDSGVEWIGKVPEHWEMKRVSNFGVFFKGSGIRKDEVKEEGIPCIRYGEIYTKYNRVVYKPVSFIDEETSKNSVMIRKGDVLFTGSGETVEDIGKTIVYYGETDIFIGGDIIVLRLNEGINPLFISYLMNTNFVQYQKSLSGRGEIIVHIYSKNIKEIITPLPPQNEQQQIVEFLDTRTKEIDDLISLEQRKIDVLKDYRKSLISEVITGKIDVRTNLN